MNCPIRNKILDKIKKGEIEYKKNGNLELLKKARREMGEWFRNFNKNNKGE